MSGVRFGPSSYGTALPKAHENKAGALGNLQAKATQAAASAYNRRVATANTNRKMAAMMAGLSLGGKGRRKTRTHRHRRPKMTRRR
jgi:hypothetical protein